MDLIAGLRTFVRVAEAGSFTAVAREMGSTQPAVSRQVAALEEHLGARLIQRTTRSLALTEDGRDLLAHARRVLDAAEEAEAAVGHQRGAPRGLVRLATPSVFGRLYIAPRLGRLLERYPELSLELHVSDRPQDLVAEGIDLAVRAATAADSSLIARRIGSSSRITVAAASYLDRHDEPRHPEELAGHSCIPFLQHASPFDWHFDGPGGEVTVRVSGRFSSDGSEAVREAVLAGIGFAVLPGWYFAEELLSGEVRAVLPGWQPPRIGLNAVYPSRRHLPQRTRAVIDFLVDELRLDPELSSYGEA